MVMSRLSWGLRFLLLKAWLCIRSEIAANLRNLDQRRMVSEFVGQDSGENEGGGAQRNSKPNGEQYVRSGRGAD